jgi:SAM-dependent methyltransferase
MNERPESPAKQGPGSSTTDRTQFTKVLKACIHRCRVDASGSVLIVGGSFADVRVLQNCGFRRMTVSNIQSEPLSAISGFEGLELEATRADAEKLKFDEDSFDFVIAHEVLHHCRSPHAALAEMLRVTRRHVVLMEPNDSLIMRTLMGLRFSFPYELSAVIDHNCESAGVRDSCIPNYIYRWNRNDVFKTVSSLIPERSFALHTQPYWDLSADEKDLALRTQTNLHMFTRLIGASNFVRGLRFLQLIFNSLPIVRTQGNKFFCCIEKKDELQPWLIRDERGISFNRKFGHEQHVHLSRAYDQKS